MIIRTSVCILAFAVFSVMAAGGFVCPSDTVDGDSSWYCDDWGHWKTAEPCDGACGGGRTRLMRVRMCKNSAIKRRCIQIQQQHTKCAVNCNGGVYDEESDSCVCPEGTTGVCCAQEDKSDIATISTTLLPETTSVLNNHGIEDTLQCPAEKGRFPLVENPALYLFCSGNFSTVLRCQTHEIFDAAIKLCRPPTKGSFCNIDGVIYARGHINPRDGREVCDPSKDSSKWSSAVVCPDFGVSIPQKDDSRIYYRCYGEKATQHACPPLKSFDRAMQSCLPSNQLQPCYINGKHYKPAELNPVNRHEVCDSTKTSSSWSKVFICPRANGSFPHPTDRTLFYTCHHGEFISLRVCKAHAVFVSDKQRCWYPSERAGCLIRGVFYDAGQEHPQEDSLFCNPMKSTTEWTPYFECPTEDGRYADIRNPRRYYDCLEGDVSQKSCPDGTMFFSDTQRCEHIPEESFCIIRNRIYAKGFVNPTNIEEVCSPEINRTAWTKVQKTRSRLKQQADDFECPESNGLYQMPSDRTAFIQCINSKAYVRTCFGGSVFFEYLQRCAYVNMVMSHRRFRSWFIPLIDS